jgi:hypothetical protein
MPVRRYKDATVVIEAKGGSYCALVHASVGQPHMGGGRYASEYGVDEFVEAIPVTCK